MLTYTGQKLEFEEMINQVIWGDCLEVMRHIPDKSVDLVLICTIGSFVVLQANQKMQKDKLQEGVEKYTDKNFG
jgi:DNA modification methylase